MLACLVAPFTACLLLLIAYVIAYPPMPYGVADLVSVVQEVRNAALLTSLFAMPWILLLRWRGRLRWRPVCWGTFVLGVGVLLLQVVRVGPAALHSDVYGLDLFLMDWNISPALFCLLVGGLFGLAAGIAFCLAAGVPVRRTGQ